jgi:hypothetical protein
VRLRLAGVAAVLAFLVGWPAFEHGYRRGGDRPLAWADLSADVAPLRLPRPTTRVFRDERSLTRFLRNSKPGRRVPAGLVADGRDEAILVSAGPRSSRVYLIRVRRVVEQRARVVLTAEERAPTLRNSGASLVSYPFVLLRVPATGKPVEVVWEGR